MGQIAFGAGCSARPEVGDVAVCDGCRYFDWVMTPLNSGGQLVPTW